MPLLQRLIRLPLLVNKMCVVRCCHRTNLLFIHIHTRIYLLFLHLLPSRIQGLRRRAILLFLIVSKFFTRAQKLLYCTIVGSASTPAAKKVVAGRLSILLHGLGLVRFLVGAVFLSIISLICNPLFAITCQLIFISIIRNLYRVHSYAFYVMHLDIYTHKHLNHGNTHAYKNVQTYTHTHTRTHTNVCIYVCLFIYIYVRVSVT